MTFLLVSMVMLGAGPVIYSWLRHRRTLLRLLDFLIVASITGLIVLEILPESMRTAGWGVLIAVVAGGVLPTIVEHVLHRTDFHRVENWTHRLTLAAGLSGLALHAMLDGAAIAGSAPADHNGSLLSVAIVLHRLPVGLTVWWLLRPVFGQNLALTVLGAMAAATVVGFVAGTEWQASLTGAGASWFQAFVSGSLLHVVFFRQHLDHG